MKSKGIAYLLLLFGGIFGFHKFYLGRPLMGLLYLCTGGLAGIGWIYDLFTLGRQVDIANAIGHAYYSEGYGHSTIPPPVYPSAPHPSSMAGYSPEKQILLLSKTHPVLDVRQVVAGTNLDIEEAEAALSKLSERGLARLSVDSNGKVTYDFG